tara:strand:- start:1209 stop:1481 length:273 start_codon:yes stop_codon:yes gene_type:complete
VESFFKNCAAVFAAARDRRGAPGGSEKRALRFFRRKLNVLEPGDGDEGGGGWDDGGGRQEEELLNAPAVCCWPLTGRDAKSEHVSFFQRK